MEHSFIKKPATSIWWRMFLVIKMSIQHGNIMQPLRTNGAAARRARFVSVRSNLAAYQKIEQKKTENFILADDNTI